MMDERRTRHVAMAASGIIHLIVLIIGFPFLSPKPPQKDYRIPVRMRVVTEPVPPTARKKVGSHTPTSSKKKYTRTQKTVPPTPKKVPGDRDAPILVNKVEIIRPKSAENYGWSGTVVVDFLIGANGNVTGVKRIVRSTGHKALDDHFIRWVRAYYQFKPKRMNGRNRSGVIQVRHTYAQD